MKKIGYFFLSLIAFACQPKASLESFNPKEHGIYTFDMAISPWVEINGKPNDTSDFFVFISYSVDCPVSKQYLPVILALKSIYEKKGVHFIILAQNEESRKRIIEENKFFVHLDTGAHFAVKLFHLKVTPEAVLTRSDGSVLYHGAIDNWAIDFKQRLPLPTQFYLQESIDEVLENSQPSRTHVPAVGCFLEHVEEGLPHEEK